MSITSKEVCVKITQQSITSKLKNFYIPPGQCGGRAFEIASTLFNQDIRSFSEKRCNSLDDVLLEISNALMSEKIVILWLDTGAIDPKNPNYRGVHCYFVFEDKPLQSFAIWDAPGAKFYDDTYTKTKIVETIKLFINDGGIGLHVVPPPLLIAGKRMA